MSLEALIGRTYGPVPLAIEAGRVADFVAATGDDPERWRNAAPPGFAAAVLFAVAPMFFSDPDAATSAAVLIHADQRFEWAAPLRVGVELEVSGVVDNVRARGPLNFVTFRVVARDAGGDAWITSAATFLMTAAGTGVGESAPEEAEAAAHERAGNDVPVPMPLPEPGADLPPLAKSASRADLVRYAGASGDFNPIHWDHAAARDAGLPGVIAHGLLMACWMIQSAARTTPGDRPLREIRLRFRKALRPAVAAAVSGSVLATDDGAASIDLALRAGEELLVSARAVVAQE